MFSLESGLVWSGLVWSGLVWSVWLRCVDGKEMTAGQGGRRRGGGKWGQKKTNGSTAILLVCSVCSCTAYHSKTKTDRQIQKQTDKYKDRQTDKYKDKKDEWLRCDSLCVFLLSAAAQHNVQGWKQLYKWLQTYFVHWILFHSPLKQAGGAFRFSRPFHRFLCIYADLIFYHWNHYNWLEVIIIGFGLVGVKLNVKWHSYIRAVIVNNHITA